jgi:excisionase family DNA binding protein
MTSNRDPKPTQLLSVAAAAGRLDCSAGHVYNLIALGKLRAVEISGTGKRPKTRVREDDLEAYIDSVTRTIDPRSPRGGGAGEVRRVDGT